MPKRKITSNDFLKAIKSILNFNEIKNNKIKGSTLLQEH